MKTGRTPACLFRFLDYNGSFILHRKTFHINIVLQFMLCYEANFIPNTGRTKKVRAPNRISHYISLCDFITL